MFVYTIQPVVKPVVQPVSQPVVSCKRGITLTADKDQTPFWQNSTCSISCRFIADFVVQLVLLYKKSIKQVEFDLLFCCGLVVALQPITKQITVRNYK